VYDNHDMTNARHDAFMMKGHDMTRHAVTTTHDASIVDAYERRAVARALRDARRRDAYNDARANDVTLHHVVTTDHAYPRATTHDTHTMTLNVFNGALTNDASCACIACACACKSCVDVVDDALLATSLRVARHTITVESYDVRDTTHVAYATT
jgi:hypothetical protein